ncbi:hypothetical protein [Nonomuraea sp. NPDC049750]|uniref:hypothetical protein n=1 Tax=Nonomuraea sp. NPDC049750 TaxID=3154738 RepID=UPI0033C135D8
MISYELIMWVVRSGRELADRVYDAGEPERVYDAGQPERAYDAGQPERVLAEPAPLSVPSGHSDQAPQVPQPGAVVTSRRRSTRASRRRKQASAGERGPRG